MLGQHLALQGEVERGIALIREARETYQSSGDVRGLSITSSNYGFSEFYAGRYESAQKLFAETLPFVAETGDRWQAGVTHISLAAIAALQDERFGEAAVLLAAGDSHLEELGVPLPPFMLPIRQSAEAALREHLDPEELRKAREAGSRLTVRQSVDYVRQMLDSR